MWKSSAVVLILTIGAAYHFGSQSDPAVPKLFDEHWGPKKSSHVDESIRDFKISFPKSAIVDLKQRLNNTRTLQKPLEGVAWTYGISSDFFKTVLEHWKTKYDWLERQALLNKYPQFKTQIQGLDIHFYRVKPTVPKDRKIRVLPLLLLHGWPGSVVEFQKIFPLLTTPRPDKDFVFEVVAPSLPGYGFSEAAVRPGLGASQMAVIMKNLMLRLGHDKFYAQGGDWGSLIATNLAILYQEKVTGLHLNMCVTRTSSSILWSIIGAYVPSFVIDNDYYSRMYPLSYHWSRLIEEMGYFHLQATKPDTVGVALSDSPAGLGAYILEKFSTWTNPAYRFREDGGLLEKYELDELLDNVMVYWLTNSITTSMRLYAENFSQEQRNLGLDSLPVKTPAACAVFPYELMYQPESMIRKRFVDLIHYNHLPQGGHFAAFEEPRLLADDFWIFVSSTEERIKIEEGKKKPDVVSSRFKE